MIKINWNKIDPKYKFAAMDANGDVYVYEQEPETWHIDGWGSSGGSLKIADGNSDWKDSLQERP